MRRVQAVSKAEWRSVAEWGLATRGEDWRLGAVVRTMADCAAEGWKRPPGARIARRAIRALELYRDEHGAEPSV